ncbi:nicotinate (nicotinamide) nucleotide adenylyltransferase [candidate division WOR-3 bacterium]|nr:nicotinate (nicotinamide) nucleotide adenylyltransferase [candidate division WOR-3 bacterium]
MPVRLGVFGGSFNPVHFGHLLVADDVREQLRLDRMLFIPAFRPPHKRGPIVPYRHRLAMTRLAVAGQPGFELCPIEEARSGPSYTADTLRELRSRYPGAMLYLAVGSDQYRDVASWHRPGELTELARIVVMSRPEIARPPLFRGHDPRRVLFRAVIPVGISAAQIRARLAKGRSIRYMLPVRVAEYVRRHRLYRGPTRKTTT